MDTKEHIPKSIAKHSVIVLAPTPPPYMGPSIATEILLNSKFTNTFNVYHIDTADRRPLNKLSKVDFTNIYLALKHYSILLLYLIRYRTQVVYIPISQTSIGFLRDFPFILLGRIFRKRVILHLRGGNFRNFYEEASVFMRWFIRRTLAHIDRMIVLGETFRPLFDNLVEPEKISVVPNGCDIHFSPENTNNHDETIKILFLANLIPEKGLFEVLHAIPLIVQAHRNVKFQFAGGWRSESDRESCLEFIKTKEVSDFVEFLDIIKGERKRQVLADSDVFVFPTFYKAEGHPWVIVEAMAAGLPIITTDWGCIKESVIHDTNGFIITPRNHEEVAEHVCRLIENKSLRLEMGRASRLRYEEKFTETHFAESMIRSFQATLN